MVKNFDLKNKTDSWLHVYINDEEITCTKENPFYILNTDNDTELINFEGRNNSEYKGQWVAAKNLKAGMKTLLSNNKNGTISSVEIEELDTPEDTYNFEVRDYHTYYVGNEGILVHNFCHIENADYYVKYKSNGKTIKAYHQASGPHEGLFIARDVTTHGGGALGKSGSTFKLLREVSGSKLQLLSDLNVDGIKMFAKHSSKVAQLFDYFGKVIL